MYLLFWDRDDKLDLTNFTKDLLILSFYAWGIVAWFLINLVVFGDPLFFKKRYSFVNNIDSDQHEYVNSFAVQILWVIKYGGLLFIFAVIGIWKKGKEFYNISKELKIFFLWIVLLIIVVPILIPGFNDSGRFVIVLLTLLAIFIPAGINSIFKRPKYKEYIICLSIFYLIFHSCLYIYYVSNKPEHSNAHEVTRFIDKYISEKRKAILISEGFIEHPHVDPVFYSRSVGQTTCGRSCTYTAKDLPIATEKDLESFIESNNVSYFIIKGEYESFDEQEKICRGFLLRSNFNMINDLGHSKIYENLNDKNNVNY